MYFFSSSFSFLFFSSFPIFPVDWNFYFHLLHSSILFYCLLFSSTWFHFILHCWIEEYRLIEKVLDSSFENFHQNPQKKIWKREKHFFNCLICVKFDTFLCENDVINPIKRVFWITNWTISVEKRDNVHEHHQRHIFFCFVRPFSTQKKTQQKHGLQNAVVTESFLP